MNPQPYAYRVIWSEDDREFVGPCAEFPGLSWLAAKQNAALAGIVKLVKQTAGDLETNGEPVPPPLSLQKFSDKFAIRTTPETHRRLVLRALEHGVSLNRLVNNKLLDAVS